MPYCTSTWSYGKETLTEYYNLRNDDKCDVERVKLLSKYALNVLELTAEHPGYDNNRY